MGWIRRSEHPEEQLSAYIDGELDARQAETVARHLAACPQCSETLEELRGAKTMLSVLPREEARRSFVLGPEHAREHARVTASTRAPARRSSFSFAPAVAATVLIGLLLVDALSLSSTSYDEGATFAGSDKTELSRQTEDSAGGAPAPAIAPGQPGTGTANSSAATEPASTPAAARAGAAESTAGGSTAPTAPGTSTGAQSQPSVPPPATGENAPAPTGPLSTFAADQPAPQPAQDADAIAETESPEADGDGLSTLRVLQILAGLAFVGSVFYVYVRPRLFERK